TRNSTWPIPLSRIMIALLLVLLPGRSPALAQRLRLESSEHLDVLGGGLEAEPHRPASERRTAHDPLAGVYRRARRPEARDGRPRSSARIPAHDPERSDLQDQRGRDGGGESPRDAGALERERQDEEEAGEGEQPEQQSPQHANRGAGPIEMMREPR